MTPLLRVRDLRVDFAGSGLLRIHALNGIAFEMQRGEILGVLGESGCGKSTLGESLLRVLPKSGVVCGGTIDFEGHELLELAETEMAKLRGAKIALIPQEPSLALSPVMKVGDQISEVLHAHRDWSWNLCRNAARALLERVNLHSEQRDIYNAYPHQLSGGQLRRVVIAQALSCEPSLIIADEPNASLDPETARQILQLLYDLTRDLHSSLLLITHDPRILLGTAGRVAVMYFGRIVEQGPAEKVLRAPQHPYANALMACVPRPCDGENSRAPSPLPSIQGTAPDPASSLAGCAFAPRCSRRVEVCGTRQPEPFESGPSRQVECFLYGN
jgi:oligopeptide/dipeptide ABC transporter ATP-binding protein